MKIRDSYNTKQKDIILNDIKKHKDEFTIKDIYNELNESIGLTTIYRLVDKLVKEGSVNKSIGKDNITYYQYLEKCDKENHFFLKCEMCGTMEHIDCDCIEELSNHIAKEHNFSLTDHIIINGKCKKCYKRGF
jgi:Fur family ferric uptake transcriptional regulator